ncbi:hypothetical protein E2C01_043171 [Portunus trituberculatus]|uniref:Uncharacterized protein n=1 Tax=Portunus trituberculatus TaxID=210409 RepID=A0A5B7FS79_PORTR|nr:hypothetical protein [Portunus trituberculatus]
MRAGQIFPKLRNFFGVHDVCASENGAGNVSSCTRYAIHSGTYCELSRYLFHSVFLLSTHTQNRCKRMTITCSRTLPVDVMGRPIFAVMKG